MLLLLHTWYHIKHGSNFQGEGSHASALFPCISLPYLLLSTKDKFGNQWWALLNAIYERLLSIRSVWCSDCGLATGDRQRDDLGSFLIDIKNLWERHDHRTVNTCPLCHGHVGSSSLSGMETLGVTSQKTETNLDEQIQKRSRWLCCAHHCKWGSLSTAARVHLFAILFNYIIRVMFSL